MVKAIKVQLKKDNPKMPDEELKSRAHAIATKQWQKSHGGKNPSEGYMVEYYVPIEEKSTIDNNFYIVGVAINETVTRNNIKYTAEELEKSAEGLKGKPILKDHKNEVDSIVGRTIESTFKDGAVRFKGKIMDESVKAKIENGLITSVSVGARVKELTKNEEGDETHYIAKGIDFCELSLVAIPGDPNASLNHNFEAAIAEKFDIQQMEVKMAEEPIETPVAEKAEVKTEKPSEPDYLKAMKEMADSFKSEMTSLKAELTQLKEKPKAEEKMDKTKGEVVTSEKKAEEGYTIERYGGKICISREGVFAPKMR